MKANSKDLVIAKKRVEMLKGVDITLKVNQGRNKIVRYDGRVESLYKGIFTIKSLADDKIYSYPYSDLITKNVKFLKK